jgi:hypothetical protein
VEPQLDQTGNYASADQFADRIRNGSSAITVPPASSDAAAR